MTASVGNRVLMLLENNPYPDDHRVCREATALLKAGCQVAVIAPGTKGQPRRETLDGIHVYRFRQPQSGSSFVGYVWEYGYSMAASLLLSVVVLLRHGFDIVHAHNPPDTFVVIGAMYKLLGKRFVFDHHDISPEMYQARFAGGGNRLVYKVLVLFEKFSCRLADHVISTNESYKQLVMERSGIPEDRITIIRNGPQRERVKLVPPDPKLRLRGSTILFYVGVIGYQDGVDYLLRALQHLRDDLKQTDFCCCIVGTGDAWESLKQLSSELGLDDVIWFTGYVSDADLLSYMSTADICVDPDPSNPFNDRSTMIKMMEYMALGKPIVAFDLPEHRVSAGDAALYATDNNELDFAKKIAQLIDDPELRERMGRIGRERIATKLAWHHQENNLLEAYQRLGVSLRVDSESKKLRSEQKQVDPAGAA